MSGDLEAGPVSDGPTSPLNGEIEQSVAEPVMCKVCGLVFPFWHDHRCDFDDLRAENALLREALEDIILRHHWVDSHPGHACKRLLNPVRLATWERWRAALTGSTAES